ncbi:MAG: cytochrome P450 [Acidimicrobiia bacterium]
MFRFDPFAPEIDVDPFPAYRTLRDEYPCFWSEEAGMWVLSRYADVVGALSDPGTFSSAHGNMMTEFPNRAGATLGTTDPPHHDRLRGLIQHAFVRRNLNSLTPDIEAIARNAAESVRDRDRFDFILDFSSKFTVRVLFAVLGIPMEDEEIVRQKAVLMVQNDPVTRDKGPEHIAAFEWVKDYAAVVIAERQKHPHDDLITHFAEAEIDGDRLDEREVLLTTTTLIMAGVESLGGFMSMFALNLADFPDARRRCVENPDLLRPAMEESLRYNTSAQRFKRRLTRDHTMHGQSMKMGDFVCLAYGSANRDERQYPDADVYDIDRSTKGHVGFGGGTHICLGTTIARMSVKIAMKEFHDVVPEYRRVHEDLPWMPSSTFRSPLVLELATN